MSRLAASVPRTAGGFWPDRAATVRRNRGKFQTPLERLPHDARRLLLLAAADPLGDPALLWRAAQELGIGETAANVVESAGLLTLNGTAAFRHPLVRSAVYSSAEPSERREVHRALANATDPQLDPDRRAWHRAQAASIPDEDVAEGLERSAAQAQARGGYAAAAAFLERAVELSPEPSGRARRALKAAQATFQAGYLDDASGLLAIAEPRTAVGRLSATTLALRFRQTCATSIRCAACTAPWYWHRNWHRTGGDGLVFDVTADDGDPRNTQQNGTKRHHQ